MSAPVCRGLSADEIEKQYALRKLRPAYEKEMVPGWLERSARFRAEHPGARIDLAYGPGPRDRFDFFPTARPGGAFLVYIHGGYWQRGDKSVYSILARPFTDAGIDVALVNYDLCPSVPASAIAPQVRRGVAHLWRTARELGAVRKRFCVMGHSAGGHLAAEMMATRWGEEAADLPADMIDAGLPFSGIFDFTPILHCSENGGMKMDAAVAAEISTIRRSMGSDAPQLVAWGENETPDWRLQSQQYVERFATPQRRIEAYVVPGADHFDVVDVLADPQSELTARARALILG
jgi:arylformamidase